MRTLTQEECTRFEADGLLVLRGWTPPELVTAARAAAIGQLAERRAPIELEVDVGYPGAPATRATPGSETVRRLLRAYERDDSFRALSTAAPIAAALRTLIGAEVLLVQSHHNCVMTKMPSFSSLTNWHQDIRYWSYQRPELISAWFALGAETEDNGCLSFVPGSHRMNFARERLDDNLFLRMDRDDNRALLATAVTPSLDAGDLVLFHCRLFHAAESNRTTETKFSPVFTYRAVDNPPLAGTKSALVEDVALPVV